MAATIGRKAVLRVSGAVVAGVQEKSVSVNGEQIDISDDNSNGWSELLDEVGEISVEMTLSGITKATVLRIASLTLTDRIKAVTLTYTDGGVLAGNFYFGTYSESHNYKGVQTFEQAIKSSGAVTYTPGP